MVHHKLINVCDLKNQCQLPFIFSFCFSHSIYSIIKKQSSASRASLEQSSIPMLLPVNKYQYRTSLRIKKNLTHRTCRKKMKWTLKVSQLVTSYISIGLLHARRNIYKFPQAKTRPRIFFTEVTVVSERQFSTVGQNQKKKSCHLLIYKYYAFPTYIYLMLISIITIIEKTHLQFLLKITYSGSYSVKQYSLHHQLLYKL